MMQRNAETVLVFPSLRGKMNLKGFNVILPRHLPPCYQALKHLFRHFSKPIS